MIKIAVIGVGSMGQNHARIYFHSDNSTLVAIADAFKQNAEKIGKHYHIPYYENYQEMLRKEQIDAVSIAVPTNLHKEVALFCLNQKKHVLLEKPIAPTESDAQEIIECAKKNNVILMIGHIERFNTAITTLKSRLQQNQLGEIYKINVERVGPFPSRITDVGVIADLSVHDIDIIRYLIEAEPIKIYAQTQQKLHPRHEDAVIGLLTYDKSIQAILNINYLSPTKVRQLQIFGKKGMFQVNYLTQELYFFENNSFASDNWESVTEGDMKKIIVPKKEPLQLEIEHFLQCIKENKKPLVTGEDGLIALEIANKLIKSSQENKIITQN
jgi:predicted dehydrogenase